MSDCLWGFYRALIDLVFVIILPFFIYPILNVHWIFGGLIGLVYGYALIPVFKPLDSVDKKMADDIIKKYKKWHNESGSIPRMKEKSNNIPAISNCLGVCSTGLYVTLEKYYKYPPVHKDCFIFENLGFILAYIHLTGVVTDSNIHDIIDYMTTELAPCHIQDKEGKRNIECAVEFYSKCFYEMLTTKTWTLPDRIVYNLERPQTWNDFSNGIPANEINFLEMMEIYSKVGDFISEVVNPQIAKLSDQTK